MTAPDPRFNNIRAAIVDLDGTMVDTADDFAAALNEALATLSLRAIARDEVVQYIGKGSERLIRDVLASRLSPAEAADLYQAAFDAYQAAYAKINGQYSTLYPEVEAGLAALKASGLLLACVTNKPERFARDLLAHFHLDGYFLAVYGGDSLPRKKPDPLPMLTACETLGVAGSETVAIGDSENDLIAARAAGLLSLTVPYGYNHGKPVHTLGTDAIVGNLREAAAFLSSCR